MIDLHLYSNLSIGSLNRKQICELVKQKKINYFSITDRNHALAYEGFDFKKINGLIPGVELTTSFNGVIINVLAYKVNPSIINEWYYDFYQQSRVEKNESRMFIDLLKIMDAQDIRYSENLSLTILEPGIAKKVIYQDIISYKQALPFDSYEDYYYNFITNPFSDFYINEAKIYPSLDEVMTLIKKAGGLAFLAHPKRYKISRHSLKKLLNSYELDGLEIFHPTISYQEAIELLEFCEDNNFKGTLGSGFYQKDHYQEIDKDFLTKILESNIFDWFKK